jgi:hypothetical protein
MSTSRTRKPKPHISAKPAPDPKLLRPRLHACLEKERASLGRWQKRLAQAASAAGKLQEIVKKLGTLKGGDSRVAKAREYVQSQIKRIKLASIEAI